MSKTVEITFTATHTVKVYAELDDGEETQDASTKEAAEALIPAQAAIHSQAGLLREIYPDTDYAFDTSFNLQEVQSG